MAEFTPMMRQYFKIKEQHKDEILFYRLGDFYEMFFDDAITVSRELELVLTGRECGQPERAPMCGVPFHAADTYIARLIAKGYKVAVCEQVEDPTQAKGLVERDIVRIVTPGTVTDSVMLDESKNNYLASIVMNGNSAGLCFSDVSTGAVFVCELSGDRLCERVINELAKYVPSEIRLNETAAAEKTISEYIGRKMNAYTSTVAEEAVTLRNCTETVENHFRKSLDELDLSESPCAVCALGENLSYLYNVQRNDVSGIVSVNVYTQDKYMKLDASARRNLELTESERRREKKGSLLWVLDKTKTAMGKRMMHAWVEQPLVSVGAILQRQNAVEELYNTTMLRSSLIEILSGINDLERIITRIVYGTANAKELKTLSQTLALLPAIKGNLDGVSSQLLKELSMQIDPLCELQQIIDEAICDEPPFSVREGGMIRDGYNSELDELRQIESGGKNFIEQIENRERERTGIKKLKVGYNRVFGYYIEVSNQFKENVPEDYIRKQTLVNGERFITSELKDLEAKVLGARERIGKLEYELFNVIRQQAADEHLSVRATAQAIAQIDALCSLAETAVQNGYSRPVVDASDRINIREGRHPVVEKYLNDAPFVPNDTLLDCGENRTAIITGPNMAGKSTYMRQTALIVIMAQIGSFVPAVSAEIGVVDAVFTRVGASDDLAAGQSTFMTEMSEVASILSAATVRSLVILDEIGRGTSTFDGMSIARAVLEYTNDRKKLGCKTLFATHYHELTEMENEIDGIRNYNTCVKKRGDDITFLRRIVRGTADGSYGIEVAYLAGIPKSVVNRAKVILKSLEEQAPEERRPVKKAQVVEETEMQFSFLDNQNNAVIDELRLLDINTLTPIEALTKLYEIKSKLV
ncbi:MAG: DNA mismatch repair protein MutS [Clostridia bacterium]|nr:DNA mismatch repair protein MutS [Clostridia bacterium]